MIAFASFSVSLHDNELNYGASTHHPDVEDDFDMDEQDDEFADVGRKSTCPGEPLTSSQAFMR